MRDHRIGSGRPPKVWGGSHCLLDQWHTHPETLMAMRLEVRDHPFSKTPTDQCIDDPFVTPTPRITASSSSGDAGSSPTAQMLMQRREYRPSQPHHGLSDQDEASSQILVQVPIRQPFRPPQPANRNVTANPTTLDTRPRATYRTRHSTRACDRAARPLSIPLQVSDLQCCTVEVVQRCIWNGR